MCGIIKQQKTLTIQQNYYWLHQINMTVRINKYLASLGVAARRKIDELISLGQVVVNDKPATMGQQIDPDHDSIAVQGKKVLVQDQPLVYFAINKPVGYVSTASDPLGRRTVLSLVPTKYRVFPVGRLDVESRGLLFLTNDGELTQALTHPRHHVPKRYRVEISGDLTDKSLFRFRTGVQLKHERMLPSEVFVLERSRTSATIEIVLTEGRNRQIRRMCQALNLEVTDLQRVSVGSIELGELEEGKYRKLTDEEVSELKTRAGVTA